MRTMTLALLILLASCSDSTSTNPEQQPPAWELQADAANFAILQVDYETVGFEGGQFTVLDPCVGCDQDAIPVDFTRRPAGDFGWNLFTYVTTGDSLFYGTTVWAGRGDRVLPMDLLPPDEFRDTGRAAADPLTVEYFGPHLEPGNDDERAAAEAAWAAVRSLDITRAFARTPYRVGLFLYPRSVGIFDPAAADWLVILYSAGP